MKLGSWISHVRSRYKANLLDKDLAQQLRELGLSLEMKSLQWNDTCQLMVRVRWFNPGGSSRSFIELDSP